jgi:autotransporter-associated beta strand protein
VTRIDLGPLPDLSGGPATEESVLAIRPYEAYRFPTMPFTLRLSAKETAAEVTADAQTSVKLDPIQPGLESKITFHVGQRRTYRFDVAVPDDFHLPEVKLPAPGIWSIEKEGSRNVLKILMQQGVLGDAAVIVRGKLAPFRRAGFSLPDSKVGPNLPANAPDTQPDISLPRLEVLGVARQEADIAVQAEPAFDVHAGALDGCRETELQRVEAWLDPPLRALTRLALHATGGNYSGKLRLAPRTPDVVCQTVTNVRISERAIEEKILLLYTIRNAGIHEVTFLLPASMGDARISTPQLRRKTRERVGAKPDSPWRVRVELQSDVMNDLRVLVEDDRLLTPGSDKAPHAAPLPVVERAVVQRQYVVLEIENRDELIEKTAGMQVLSRQQQEWRDLSALLGGNPLQKAYLVQSGAAAPQFGFYLQRHEEAETAGARIDLAETTIVVDAAGAYRAQVEFSLDNSSEQFLDVELPDGATLWAILVKGQPVKPAQAAGATGARNVLVPVQKTAKGDPNYPVVLKYGGRLPPASLLSKVQFPLVRKVKPFPAAGRTIGIERSQVRIYVPKSQQWFNFGGTLHPAEEADLKAGQFSAFNREGEKLIAAARDKDVFTSSRATDNLKHWLGQAEAKQQAAVRGENQALSSQINTNVGMTKMAKDIVDASGDRKQSEGTITARVGNDIRLEELYEGQVNVNGGLLALTGSNTYSGGTVVNNGTLVAGSTSALPGFTTVNGGTLATGNSDAQASVADFNSNWITRNNLNNDTTLNATGFAAYDTNGNNVTVGSFTGNGGLVFAGSGVTLGSGALSANGGVLDLNGYGVTAPSFSGASGSTLSLEAGAAIGTDSGGNNADFSYRVAPADTKPGANASVTHSGAGVFTLNGASTYSGGTTISGGTLQVGNGATNGSFRLGGGGGTLQFANPNPNLATGRVILNPEQQFGGQGNVTLSAAPTNLGIGVANGSGTFGGTLQNGGASLYVNGALATAQPSGPTVVNNGELVLESANAAGNAAATGLGGLSGANHVVLGGATTDYTNGALHGSSALTLSGGSVTLTDNGTLVFNGSNAVTQGTDFSAGAISGAGSLTKTGSGLVFNGGTLTYGAGNAVGQSPAQEPSQSGDAAGKADGKAGNLPGGSTAGNFGPTAPAGLASLDFELPTDENLYELFRFTTPRGEAELTARSVSQSLLGKLKMLLGIVAASLVAWAAVWLVGRGALGCFRRPWGAIFLFLLGLVLLCSQVLPYLGLIALLAGIILFVTALLGGKKAVA